MRNISIEESEILIVKYSKVLFEDQGSQAHLNYLFGDTQKSKS